MKPVYLLDTNVLLYALSLAPDHLPKQPVALQWLRRGDWCVSAQVLMEFFNNARQPRHGLSLALVHDMVRRVVEQRAVQAVDAALVMQALALAERYQISHWDAAIVCAAQRLGAHTVVSEDLNAGQTYDGVRVLNPFAAAA
ncbi:MAG: PIN domain-containing protein [Pseudomonadota bacterium]|nr:PIN domain-containing protein [Pseudomonadota bacterium]